MATKQTVIWTALPNGWATEAAAPTLKLSVFVSPRLETSEGLPRPTLAQFPDFLEWPNKVAAASFSVQFGSGPPVAASRVGPALEPELWAALVKPTTYVKPYQPPSLLDRNIRSVPVRNVSQFLKTQYQSVVTGSPTALPRAEMLVEKLSPVTLYSPPARVAPETRVGPQAAPAKAAVPQAMRMEPRTATSERPAAAAQQQVSPPATELRTFTQSLHPRVRASATRDLNVLLARPEVTLKPQALDAYKSLAQDLTRFRAVAPTATPEPTRDFLQVALFHRRPTLAPAPLVIPEIDFHEFLSSLGSYPELMRRFGLIIDLEVPAPSGLSASGTVRVVPTWSPALSTSNDFTPKTAYLADRSAGRFMSAPGPDADLVNGLLKLNDEERHPVATYDVDGGAMKTLYLAEHLQAETMRAKEAKLAPAGIQTAVPASGQASTVPPAATQLRAAPLAMRSSATSDVSAAQRGATPGAVEKEEALTPPLTMLRSAPARERPAEVAPPPAVSTLPALRSAGIAVARTGRAVLLAKAVDKVAAHNQAVQANRPQDVTFYAEDLVRGYRVDVWDSESKSWHSLMKRIGTYQFLEAGVTCEFQDEGFVQMAVTQSPEKPAEEGPGDLYLHESMFRWDGWSLSAPRPGKSVGPKGQPERYDDPSRAVDKAQSQFKLVTSFQAAPGTLPRLRFGTTYRLRARVVDLAGNSLLLEAVPPDDFSQATPPHTYTRFEPVVPPVTLLTKSLVGAKSPGESLNNLVIRSNYDKSALEYVATFADLTANPSYAAPAERLLAAPKTSQLMAERHAMFDQPAGAMKKEADTYDMIRQRADAAFATDPASKCPIQEQLAVPYMPDPLARGATLVLLGRDGNAIGNARVVSFYGADDTWPQSSAFRIRVVEASGAPAWDWDDANRLLTVRLPKAELLTLRVSSNLGEGDVGTRHQKLMGVWNWISDAKPSNLSQMQEWARAGRVWMLTPSRDLILVHAVQQPLIAPAFHSLTPSRMLGATYAYIGDDQPMPIDGKSTVKVDIEAAWQEPLDNLAEPGPTKIAGQTHVFEYDISPDDKDIRQTLEPIFRRDTDLHLRRMMFVPAVQTPLVQQKTMLTSPQAAQGLRVTPEKPRAQAAATPQAAKLATTPAAAEFKIPPGIVVPQLPTRVGYSWRHDFGDTKYRRVSYRAVATTRFREYFPAKPLGQPDATPTQFTRESSPTEVDVPNAARPDAPKVLYLIPTFAWERQMNLSFRKGDRNQPIPGMDAEGIGVVSKRTGGGLRVYLDRPWYSSGDGELLGVLLWIPPAAQPTGQVRAATTALLGAAGPRTIPEMLRPYVSQWGMDPIWASNATYDLPALENFKRAVKTQQDLTLDELPPEWKVAVAGHAVEYDAERRLWYSDIEMDAGPSYFPFVRLALARYQPISVDNAHLSRVILADFAQLAPDRTAAVVFDRHDLRKVHVSVAGDVYAAAGAAVSRREEVEANVELQSAEAKGDVGWIPVPESTVKLKAKAFGNTIVWSEELRLPKAPGLQPFRVVVREYELMEADRGQGTQQVRRLVYADSVEVGGLRL
jgi:hypothetical protein